MKKIINNYITYEQVTKYHPDKFADQISDAILDECLGQDTDSRCNIETLVQGSMVVLSGNITSKADINYDKIVKRVATKLNYKVDGIINLITPQSAQITKAVNKFNGDIGAGDQGTIVGYACNESTSLLPYGFDVANKICRLIEEDVSSNPKTILKGDAKVLVSVLDSQPLEVARITISACHKEGAYNNLKNYLINLLKRGNITIPKEIKINPAGVWTVGGPTADCGLTGRKIVCDSYGATIPVGGGCFSGKDLSKVDRSAAYMARIIAKDIVKCGYSECLVNISYEIGSPTPVSLNVIASTDLGYKYDLTGRVNKEYDLTPYEMKRFLDSRIRVSYEKLSEGCHFRDIY